MKALIRSMLVVASSFMVVGNLNNNGYSLTASIFFFTANLTAFIYFDARR